MRYLLIDSQGIARNVVLWDPATAPDWQPPAGFTVRPDDGTPITYDAPPPLKSEAEKLAAARQALDAVANLTGPVLTADVADVLADLRTALED
jgi:hypothetical protein